MSFLCDLCQVAKTLWPTPGHGILWFSGQSLLCFNKQEVGFEPRVGQIRYGSLFLPGRCQVPALSTTISGAY